MAEWYYTQNKQQQGPVGFDQLKQLAATGHLQPTDMVWKEGLPQWLAASGVSGLFAAAAASAASPAAPPQVTRPPMASAVPHAAPAGGSSSGGLFDLLDLNFTRFVTTLIVRWLWGIWLVLAVIGYVVGSLAALAAMRSWQAGLMILIVYPCGLVIYTLLVRIWLETMIILFRIGEYLRAMNARHVELTK